MEDYPSQRLHSVAALILAAGEASRMGQPKQLLPYKEGTLLSHAIRQAIEAECSPVIVVLGAHAEQIQPSLAELPVAIAINENWRSGMGGSIRVGLHRLKDLDLEVSAAFILLSDQPLVTAAHLKAMRRQKESAKTEIVAAQYKGTLGVPALFDRSVFPKLESLPDDKGAQRVLHSKNIGVVPYDLPEAAIDVDSPDDFAGLPS